MHWRTTRLWVRTVAVALTLTAPIVGDSAAHAQPSGSPSTSEPKAAPSPVAGVVPPKLLPHPDVAYPAGATGDATIVLRLTVNVDGTVREAIAEPAAHGDDQAAVAPFARQAESEALGWHFEPATRGDRPVAAKIRIEVTFHAPPPEPEAPIERAREGAPKPAPAAAVNEPEEVRVRGEHVEPSRSASLSRAEVRQIPGTFGDPFRAIEIMPGVTPIVSGLPFFFVRGAPPGDVGYYLDGVRVPYIFHVGAGPSVVHPGLMDRVDLYPGGYPARFGRYSGGIVSGETLGPSAEARGEYNVRLFDAGALVETPFADDRGHVLLGGRYSYTAALLSLLSSNTALDYWDAQARISYDLSRKDTVSVFAFGASDYLGQKTQTTTTTLFGTQFYRVDARYDHRLDDKGNLRTAVTLGLDRTEIDNGRHLRDRMAGTRTELSYRLSPDALLRAGTDVQVDKYDIELSNSDLSPSQAAVVAAFPSRTDLSTGVRADMVLQLGKRLEVTPGARVDFYASEGATAIGVDPRLAMRTMVTDKTHLLAAMGLAHQAPSFVVTVPGFQPGGLRGGLQKALQESMGVELDLGGSTTLTATAFHNGFFDLSDALSVSQPTLNGCAPGTFPTDSLAGDRGTQPGGFASGCGTPRFTPGTVGADRSGGGGQAADSTGNAKSAAAFAVRSRGTAYGAELFLKRKLTSRVGGFLSYTLSRSTRAYGDQSFVASFDRTHVLNAALAFDLGRNWRAGTRVTFYTGLPKAPDPTDPGATRLSPFFRLDLRLEKRWQLSKKWWISAVAEWMNATLSKESIGTSCTLNGCQENRIGPITIPSLGVEGGF